MTRRVGRVRPRRGRWRPMPPRSTTCSPRWRSGAGFRDYLQGLLLPARAEQDAHRAGRRRAGRRRAGRPRVQRLQWFLSESPWDAEAVNARRLELAAAPTRRPRPHDGGRAGHRRHRGPQGRHAHGPRRAAVPGLAWARSSNGIVAVTSLWADERVYYPLHAASPTRRPSASPAGKARSGLPHQAAAGGGVGRRRRWPRACPSGRWWPTASTARTTAFDGALRARGAALRAGAEALAGHLGSGARRHHTPVGGRPGGCAGAAPATPGDWTPVVRALPRRAHARPGGRPRCSLGPAGPDCRQRGWSWRRPTRPPCPPLSTWYLATQPAPRRARPHAPRAGGRARPTWPRWCGSTGCGCGWSRATSRSSTSWAGPTSRSAPTARIRAPLGSWSAAPSPSAGAPGSARRRPLRNRPTPSRRPGPRGRRPHPGRQRGGRAGGRVARLAAGAGPVLAGGLAARPGLADAVESASGAAGARWSTGPPPAVLQALLDAVAAGHRPRPLRPVLTK